MDLKALVRNIPDFPKPGILFRDITPLIGNADGFEELVNEMAKPLFEQDVDLVVGPEARGFIFGSALANTLHAGFVPARKPGKLPYETIGYAYDPSTRFPSNNNPARSLRWPPLFYALVPEPPAPQYNFRL